MTERHFAWPPLAMPGGGQLGWSPTLGDLECLHLEMGERVALVADDQAISGGPVAVILLSAAPHDPRKGN
jgi:hypothetical protein